MSPEGTPVTAPEPVTVVESPDGHVVTVDATAGEWSATATCAACSWDGAGWVVVLTMLAGNHAEGTDGSR